MGPRRDRQKKGWKQPLFCFTTSLTLNSQQCSPFMLTNIGRPHVIWEISWTSQFMNYSTVSRTFVNLTSTVYKWQFLLKTFYCKFVLMIVLTGNFTYYLCPWRQLSNYSATVTGCYPSTSFTYYRKQSRYIQGIHLKLKQILPGVYSHG